MNFNNFHAFLLHLKNSNCIPFCHAPPEAKGQRNLCYLHGKGQSIQALYHPMKYLLSIHFHAEIQIVPRFLGENFFARLLFHHGYFPSNFKQLQNISLHIFVNSVHNTDFDYQISLNINQTLKLSCFRQISAEILSENI